MFLVVFNDPFLVMPRYRCTFLHCSCLGSWRRSSFQNGFFYLFANKKVNIKEGYSLKFQLPKTFFQPYEILVSNSRSHGHHHGELLAAWWWVRDVSALNLCLAGGFMNKIKALNTSAGAAQGGKTQVERLDVMYLSPGCTVESGISGYFRQGFHRVEKLFRGWNFSE